MEINISNLKIPTEWSEITLSQLKEIMLLKEDNIVEKIKKYINILTGVDMVIINFMSEQNMIEIFNKMKFIENENIKITDYNFFTINGIEYGITKEEYMKIVEYIEASSYIDKSIENLEKIVAALLRPITFKDEYGNYEIESYDLEKCNARVPIFMKYCPATVAYTVLDFFLNIQKDYIQNTLCSLDPKNKIEMNIKKIAMDMMENGFQKSGDGSPYLSLLQKREFLETLKRLSNNML